MIMQPQQAHNTPNNDAPSLYMAIVSLCGKQIVVAPCRTHIEKCGVRHGVVGQDVI